MKEYKEIHIWDFPPTETYVRLKDDFRCSFFKYMIKNSGSWQKFVDDINKVKLRYKINRGCSRLGLSKWIKGKFFYKGKLKKINLPLWLLICCFDTLPDDKREAMKSNVEANIEYYSCWGKSNPVLNPKLPFYLTPELVSVAFHFLGDGHIGKSGNGVSSSYRQMNVKGLDNFLLKLRNIFGDFEYSKKEYADGRLNIPKVITNFYVYYFGLDKTDTFTGYVPSSIKNLEKEFLVAGLAAFIVDEGHIFEVITIYSKNERLIKDISGIAIRCGYICYPIREKYARGNFDTYRFNISIRSFKNFYDDLNNLSEKFPTCTLVQKQERLAKKIQ